MAAVPAVAQAPEAYVMPQPDGSVIVVLQPDAVKLCMESGGCRIVTARELEAFAAEVRKTCGPST